MKKIVLMSVALVVASVTFCQKVKEADVPTTVKSAFQKLYPTATEIKWEKENGNYEVNFDLKEEDYSVVIDASGKVLETEVEIAVSQLPASALTYLKTNYKGKKIKEAAKITDANGVVTYEAEIKGKDLIFDDKGQFVKESKD